LSLPKLITYISNVTSHELGHATGVLLHYDWHLADPMARQEMKNRGKGSLPLSSDYYIDPDEDVPDSKKQTETKGRLMKPGFDEPSTWLLYKFTQSDKALLEYYFGSGGTEIEP